MLERIVLDLAQESNKLLPPKSELMADPAPRGVVAQHALSSL